jgi:tetratricopeptide (TPR) repeat protein
MIKNLQISFLIQAFSKFVLLFSIIGPVFSFAQSSHTEKEILAEQLFIQAESKRLLGRYESAIEILEEIRKKSPANTAVLYSLSRCYWELNETEQAKRITEDALRFESNNQWLLDLQLKLLERSKNYPQAIEVADKLHKITGDPVFLDKKAFLLTSIGRYAEALETLKLLEDLVGLSKDLLLTQSQLLEELQKPTEALHKIEKNLFLFQYDVEVLHHLTRLYLSQGEEEKSLKILEQILTLEENDPLALSLMSRFQSQYLEGEQALRQIIGNPKVSIDYKIKELYPQLEQLMEKHIVSEPLIELSLLLRNVHPKEPKALAFLGDVLYQSGQIHQSIEPYSQTLEITNSNYQVYLQLLRALLYTRDTEKLTKIAVTTLDLYPDQAKSYLYIGQSMLFNQSYAEGLNYVNEGLFMTGSDRELKVELLLTKAELYNMLGNWEQAENALKLALEIFPQHPLTQSSLALILVKKGLKPDEKTIKYLKKAALTDPMVSVQVADLLLLLGQLGEAEELLARTVVNYGNFYPPIVEKWGDIHLAKNNQEEAFQCYSQALSLMPNHDSLRQKMNQ